MEKVFTLTVNKPQLKQQLPGKLNKSLTSGTPPVFTVEPVKTKDVAAGSLARFTCNCTATPPATIMWLHEGTPLEHGDRYLIKHNSGLASLSIKNARDADIGSYKVVAENTVGKCEANFSLKVGGRSTRKNEEKKKEKVKEKEKEKEKEPAASVALVFQGEVGEAEQPKSKKSSLTSVELVVDTQPQFSPSVVTPLEDRTVLEGDHVVLKCQFKGHPKCKYTWFKGM